MLRKLLPILLLAVTGMAAAQDESPRLTFGVMSDLHSQGTLIDQEVDDIRLRGTVDTVLNAWKEQEKLDLIVLNGDYTSDVTILRKQWLRVRRLMVAATRAAFPDDATSTPVIYSTGNHDYEVANFDNIPKLWNAADFYSTPMQDDIGELTDDECMWEDAENGNSSDMSLLVAFHYVVKGFDFVVLNCGKYFFQSAWDYRYSLESVQWIADKLEEIYEDDPSKTVFFISHVPFRDSKSMSSPDKGLDYCEATTLLKNTLAKYPNLIHIYGHDHGSDNAYIRAKTAQRVTQYDSNGNVYSESGDGEATRTAFYIQSAVTDKYLGRLNTSSNINTYTAAYQAVITARNDCDVFNIQLGPVTSSNYLYCGSGGNFSGNPDPGDIWVYEVTSTDGATYTARLVTNNRITAGKQYILVGESDGTRYALTNRVRMAGDRLLAANVTIDGETLTYTDGNTGDNYSAVWNISETEDEWGTGKYYIKNATTSKYLGRTFSSDNIETYSEPYAATVTTSTTSGMFNVALSPNDLSNNLYIGSSGRFSGNEDVADVMLYEVTSVSDNTATATKVTSPSLSTDKQYLIVGESDGAYYALTNRVYSSGTNARLSGNSLAVSGDALVYTDTAPSDTVSALWTFEVAAEQTAGTPSFISVFDGSMRYYNNTIDTSSSTENSRVAQALMVYVYDDRVELHMKNYAESGSISGIHIADTPQPYITYRKVTGATTTGIGSAPASSASSRITVSASGGSVVVGGLSGDSRIEITDAAGRALTAATTSSSSKKLTLSAGTRGVCLVKVTTGDGTTTRKLTL